MKYFVYVLKSTKNSSLYIGISENPDKRVKEHNSGNSKYTKGHRPYMLAYKEEYPSRIFARQREKYLKSGEGILHKVTNCDFKLKIQNPNEEFKV